MSTPNARKRRPLKEPIDWTGTLIRWGAITLSYAVPIAAAVAAAVFWVLLTEAAFPPVSHLNP